MQLLLLLLLLLLPLPSLPTHLPLLFFFFSSIPLQQSTLPSILLRLLRYHSSPLLQPLLLLPSVLLRLLLRLLLYHNHTEANIPAILLQRSTRVNQLITGGKRFNLSRKRLPAPKILSRYCAACCPPSPPLHAWCSTLTLSLDASPLKGFRAAPDRKRDTEGCVLLVEWKENGKVKAKYFRHFYFIFAKGNRSKPIRDVRYMISFSEMTEDKRIIPVN